MAFKPITFLANIQRIFSASTGLTTVAQWLYPSATGANVFPTVFIEYVDGRIVNRSTHTRNKDFKFYIRFIIMAETTGIDDYFDAIMTAIRSNPTLTDSESKATCRYFGALEDEITFDLVSTQIVNNMTIHSIAIDVPCLVQD